MQSPLAISQKLLVFQTKTGISSFQHAKTTTLVRLKIDITNANMANGFLAVETRQACKTQLPGSHLSPFYLLQEQKTEHTPFLCPLAS